MLENLQRNLTLRMASWSGERLRESTENRLPRVLYWAASASGITWLDDDEGDEVTAAEV